mmetsp:Transcript_91563/g.254994  ORF Transcript_91563/g.254994 Transcript_91563/m.254994 type:complete len:511 (-) Transcript_91563:30-1562(-)
MGCQALVCPQDAYCRPVVETSTAVITLQPPEDKADNADLTKPLLRVIPWEDAVAVPEIYKARLSVVRAAHQRALRMENFMQLGEFIKKVIASFEYSDTLSGVVVTESNMNLHHVNELFIVPLTAEHCCSFMELTACAAQDPLWFISHWWGTPFFDTLRMMALHADRRNVDPLACYWMCAFAINQHDLPGLSEPDVLDTPFARAIMSPACVGTVTFLDEHNATPFTRIWCVLEGYVTLEHGSQKEPRQLFDFCTIIPEGECQGCDGALNSRCAGILLDQDDGSNEDGGCDLADPDSAWFPSHVGMLAFRTNVAKAQASSETDRQNLLRLIEGNEDKVNNIIRTLFLPQAAYMAATEIARKEGTEAALLEIMSSGLLAEEEMVRILDQQACVAEAAVYADECVGNTQCLACMLDAKCDPNNRNADNKPALQLAFERRCWNNVRLLLSFRADPVMELTDGRRIMTEELLVEDTIPEDIRAKLEQLLFAHREGGSSTRNGSGSDGSCSISSSAR